MADNKKRKKNAVVRDSGVELNENTLPNKQFDEEMESNRKKRLEYLLQRTSLYSHFISKNNNEDKENQDGNSMQSINTNTKSSKKGRAISTVKSVLKTYTDTPTYIEHGKMRDYQIEGLNWLISLYENGINGILADEMGLGKTLQTISLLGYLKNVKKIDGPFLIIAPKSTISNWTSEIKRWCPSLKMFALIGSKDERQKLVRTYFINKKQWDVCITTYEICLIDQQKLKGFKWHYLVVDEAHRIKNENSSLSKTLRKFHILNKLLLTGTPLQNNIHELWALLNYLLPDIFKNSSDFDSWFDTIDCMENEEVMKKLHIVLKPFMLQRQKAEVEKSLLPKKEAKIYVNLTQMQRELYKKILLKDIDIITKYGDQKKMRLENLIMHLQKVACHPYIVPNMEPFPYTEGEHLVQNSGKMIVLDKLLKKLKEQKSRAVIFCNFTGFLDILEDYCIMRNFKYLRLDGSTRHEQREKGIAEFNAPGSDVFLYLISTKAGGLGINLQTADVVILLESHWNPQIDSQAIDRVHRIGQKKQVRMFRIISENTIEERLTAIAESKLELSDMVIKNQDKFKADRNTIKEILKIEINQMLNANVNENNNLNNNFKYDDIDLIFEDFDNNSGKGFHFSNTMSPNLKNTSTPNISMFKKHIKGRDNYMYNFEGENYRELKVKLSNSFVENNDLPERSCKKRKIYREIE